MLDEPLAGRMAVTGEELFSYFAIVSIVYFLTADCDGELMRRVM